MTSVSKQGINRNYTLNYGTGPNGKAGAFKLEVENTRTGNTRRLAGFGASNGEKSIGGLAFSGPNVQAAAVGAKGPNGTVTAAAARGPQNAGYRIAARNAGGELKGLWRGYL